MNKAKAKDKRGKQNEELKKNSCFFVLFFPCQEYCFSLPLTGLGWISLGPCILISKHALTNKVTRGLQLHEGFRANQLQQTTARMDSGVGLLALGLFDRNDKQLPVLLHASSHPHMSSSAADGCCCFVECRQCSTLSLGI